MANDDPVADLLRKWPLKDEQRAKAWDAYEKSPTLDALTRRLLPMTYLPRAVQAELWSIKAKQLGTPVAPPQRPRHIPRNIFGQEVSLPPDVEAEFQALRQRMAGYEPPLEGDIMLRNVQTGARYAPAIGATIGARFGGAPGAAVGAGLGEVVNLAINPSERSETLLGNVGQVAGEGAVMGTTEAVLPVVGRGLRTGAEAAYRGYLKPALTQQLLPRARQIVRTAIEEALPLTEVGAKKATTLIADLNLQISQMLARTRGQTIDLHAIAERVRQFARQKYNRPGRSVENYEAALRVADRIDQHPSLGLPAGVRPTRVNVNLPTAQDVKVGLYEEAGQNAFGVATGQATKEAEKVGAHEIRVGLERRVPQIGPLNARESRLLDAGEAIAQAVERHANQNPLLGAPTLVSGALALGEYGRTGDAFTSAVKLLGARLLLSPAVISRAAIVAHQLGRTQNVLPGVAARVAIQAVMNESGAPMEATP
jgi:hypothetical protein